MEIRKARKADYQHILSAVHNKKIDFITVDKVRDDLMNDNVYCLVNNNKIVAILSLVYKPARGYYAIQRMTVLNKKDCGKGYAKALLAGVVAENHNVAIGVTPWADNQKMQHLLIGLGFKYQYTFNCYWTFYKKLPV